MRTLDARGNIGIVLLIVGVVALVGGVGSRTSFAADPDRHIREHGGDWDSERFEESLADALSVLEGMDFDMDFHMDDFADDLAEQLESALEYGAVRIDRDWPDHVRVRGAAPRVDIDTRHIARQVERIARSVERDLRIRDGHRSGWDRDDRSRDRADIEQEMRELQREMRRLARELEDLQADGDI